MSKYKKPKVGFLDHVAGKQDDPTLDDLVKNVQENVGEVEKPEPIVEKKEQPKTPVVKKEKVDPTMGSYLEATQNDPTSAKGSFDQKVTENYVPPVKQDKKMKTDSKKMSAYQKAVHERSIKQNQKVQEAADLLGGEPEKPVTQADLRQIKVSLASLGGGGIGQNEAIEIAKKYAAPLDSDQDSNLQFFLDHFDSVRDVILVATDYDTADFDSDFNTKTTQDLPEPTFVGFGDDSYNKYFTKDRARASIQSIDSAIVFDQVTGNIALDLEALDSINYTSIDFDSDFSLKTTDSLDEGDSNLYYTDSRARSALSSADSWIIYDSSLGQFSFNDSDLPEGYTSKDFDSDFLLKNTDSLSEGDSNLYYTDSRARSALSSGDSYIRYDSQFGVFTFNKNLLPNGYTTVDFDSDFDSAINISGGIIERLDSLDARCDSEDIEIALLKNKVKALDVNSAILVEYDKVLSFDSDVDSVPDGLYAVHFSGGTDYVDVDKLYFNIVDKNNVTTPLEILDSGDVIILSDSDGGIARYQIETPGILTTKPSGSEYYRFDVTALIGKGGPADTISAKYYPATDNTSLATYEYVDAADKILQDQIDDLDSAIDSEHAWNVAEHAKLDSDVSKRFDSEHAWNVAEHSNLDSQIDSDHTWAAEKFASIDSAYVNVTGDTMTGTLFINNAANLTVDSGNITTNSGFIRSGSGYVQTNDLRSVGNSNIVVKRNNERRMLWGGNNIIADKKVRYNEGYNRDSYTSAGNDYTLMPKWYIDSAVANASFEFDSSQFVDATGDSMSGALIIRRDYEGGVNFTIAKDDQDRIRLRNDGRINWTGAASKAKLNRDGGNFQIDLNNEKYLGFHLSNEELEVEKTLSLTGVEKRINLPNNSDTGELTSNKNRRLFWDKDNVGIDVGLEMNAQINMNGGNGRNKIVNLATPTDDYHAANKKYVDDNAGGGSFIKNGSETTLTGHSKIISSGTKYINIQAAPTETLGFFVMRDNAGNNLMLVHNSGQINLKAGRLATDLDEITTKRYVDTKVGLSGDENVGGKKYFTNALYAQNYLYLSNSSNNSNGVLRRDTIEAMISAAGGGDYKITKSGSNYYIEST